MYPPDKNGETKWRFRNNSVALALSFKYLECTKLLMTSGIDLCSTNFSGAVNPYKSVMNAWLYASMTLVNEIEFVDMCNMFHELVLKGERFSADFVQTFYFNQMIEYQDGVAMDYIDESYISNPDHFFYNKKRSYFLKSLAFCCNYNIDTLFACPHQCRMFLEVKKNGNKTNYFQTNTNVFNFYF